MSNAERSVVLSAEQIRGRVEELGRTLTEEYRGGSPIFVVVMHAAMVFFADLVREVRLDLLCDAVSVSSYRGESFEPQEPRLELAPRHPWAGREVLFVEAVTDTGQTARLLHRLAQERGARSSRLCTLLDKPDRRTAPLQADFVGFSIPDLFVVGYGLDYRGKGRNLPWVEALGPRTPAGPEECENVAEPVVVADPVPRTGGGDHPVRRRHAEVES